MIGRLSFVLVQVWNGNCAKVNCIRRRCIMYAVGVIITRRVSRYTNHCLIMKIMIEQPVVERGVAA